MSRATWGRLALAAGAIVVSIALAEVALRVHHRLSWSGSIEDLHRDPAIPAPGEPVTLGEMLRPSPYPRLVYELKPGLDVNFAGTWIRTSPAGWREEPHPTAKPPNTVRILGIGDSTMFGWGVAVEERYMDRLERRLHEELPATDWQSLVLAVPGYNLPMALEALERYGLAYEPDLVVYGWNPNDQCLPDFLLAERDAWAPFSFLIEHAKGVGRPIPALHERARAYDTSCLDQDAPQAYRRISGREAFREALDKLAAFAIESSTPVALVTDFGVHFEQMMAMVLPPGLIYVETVSRTAPVPRQEVVLGPWDPHPSALGHRILADALFEELEARDVWDDLRLNRGQLNQELNP